MSQPYSFRVHPCSSWDRLEKLIEARAQAGAEQDLIDENIWELFGETWAVMFTDLAGFSRSVSDFGIIHFLQTIYESHRLLVPVIDAHNGILMKLEGDSMLVIFKQPQRALHCAIDLQQALQPYNAKRQANEQVLLCVGLGYGRLLKIADEDVFGAEVNAASKLGEDMAQAGEILVTQALMEAVIFPELSFEQLDHTPPGATGAYRVKYALLEDTNP